MWEPSPREVEPADINSFPRGYVRSATGVDSPGREIGGLQGSTFSSVLEGDKDGARPRRPPFRRL